MTWKMYATPSKGLFWYTAETPNFVRLHGAKEVVAVNVRENKDGRYYGWLGTGRNFPQFIWPSEAQRDMCFPYGPASEEKLGRGRRVRLDIEVAEKETTAPNVGGHDPKSFSHLAPKRKEDTK
jgi:hypothetical protein